MVKKSVFILCFFGVIVIIVGSLFGMSLFLSVLLVVFLSALSVSSVHCLLTTTGKFENGKKTSRGIVQKAENCE